MSGQSDWRGDYQRQHEKDDPREVEPEPTCKACGDFAPSGEFCSTACSQHNVEEPVTVLEAALHHCPNGDDDCLSFDLCAPCKGDRARAHDAYEMAKLTPAEIDRRRLAAVEHWKDPEALAREIVRRTHRNIGIDLPLDAVREIVGSGR